MFKTDKLVANQVKAIESAHALAQLAIENAETIAQIQCGAVKDAVTNAQSKAGDLLKSTDPKKALGMVKVEHAQEAFVEATVIQSRVIKALRKGKEEALEMIESAIEESKVELKKLVNDATSVTPAGSEVFVSTFKTAFNEGIKVFDQYYACTKVAYANFENSVESALSSFQSKSATVSKPVAKSLKAITA
ncbi:MAG: phasin family protein [Polynucleobacter sp.]|jgi:hypothetical protein|nr:phasin family protein [Polynucleobacter sp.]